MSYKFLCNECNINERTQEKKALGDNGKRIDIGTEEYNNFLKIYPEITQLYSLGCRYVLNTYK